tara:strand:+ start:37 stop:1233 length:1197 start_codon:yes stop_codon:yes gene_type:complete
MKVIIGGAGITGLAIGCYLQQKGIDFQIFDYRDQQHGDLKKSTGIQLASNCHFVFRELGIYDQIKEASIERKNLKVHSEQNYLNDLSVTNDHNEGIFFIRRSQLISILASLIPSQKISWSTRIKADYSIENNDIIGVNKIYDDGTHVKVETQKLIKTDYYTDDFPEFVSTPICKHTADLYIDCTGSDNTFNTADTNSSAVWGISDYSDKMLKSFNNFMYSGMHLVTYPLTENKTAFTLVFDTARLFNEDQLWKICHNNSKGDQAREIVNKLLKDKFKDLINSSRDCERRKLFYSVYNTWGKGNIIRLGDSAHLITPHLAQGAAQGLIDAAYLNKGFSTNLDPEEFFAKRNSIINKIRSEAKLNKNRYQLGMPFKLLRNIYLKLYKPNYSWLFNSKYEA